MKKLIAVFLILLISLALAACGRQSAQAAPGVAVDTLAANGEELVEVNIGASGSPAPYQWLDETHRLQGYDIDVANEVARRAGLQLNWEQTEFPALFLGLDANKYQVVVNNLSYTQERGEKYLYGEEYYLRNTIVLVVPEGEQDIRSIDDLVGRSVPIGASGNTHALYLLDYNDQHPDAQIDIVVTGAESTEQLTGVATGLYDAMVTDLVIANAVINELGAGLEIIVLPDEVQEEIAPTRAYFVFSQSGGDLQERWDAALREMIEDGTLSEISLRHFGADISR